jgi:hypothetical protein
MATNTDDAGGSAAAATGGLSLRERGAATVHALSEVSRDLQPLQAKLDAGGTLTKRQVKRYAQLSVRYRELERQMRELLRPRMRPSDAALAGMDHLHAPGGGTVDVEP